MGRVFRGLAKAGMYAVEAFIVVISVFPVAWVVFSSLKTNGQILAGPFVLPSALDLGAYQYLFEKFHFLTYFGNSLFVALQIFKIQSVILFESICIRHAAH